MNLLFANGEFESLGRLADSLSQLTAPQARSVGLSVRRSLAVRGGRLREARLGDTTQIAYGPSRSGVEATIEDALIEAAITGPSGARAARLAARVDTAAAAFSEMPLVDRPYLLAAVALAAIGDVERARAMIARYRTEVTDTSLRRVDQADLHEALAEIALAAHQPREALDEFRRADVGYDGAPANECAPCLPFNLARAYDAAAMPDSAIAMYERYLATPFWPKMDAVLDPTRVPFIHERLGQLYEEAGNVQKAAENDRAFIGLWKNADPELQPRVAAARERLRKLASVEKVPR